MIFLYDSTMIKFNANLNCCQILLRAATFKPTAAFIFSASYEKWLLHFIHIYNVATMAFLFNNAPILPLYSNIISHQS